MVKFGANFSLNSAKSELEKNCQIPKCQNFTDRLKKDSIEINPCRLEDV